MFKCVLPRRSDYLLKYHHLPSLFLILSMYYTSELNEYE